MSAPSGRQSRRCWSLWLLGSKYFGPKIGSLLKAEGVRADPSLFSHHYLHRMLSDKLVRRERPCSMNLNLKISASLAIFALALTGECIHAKSASTPYDSSDRHRVEVALACDEKTSLSAKSLHAWDARYFAGP